MKKNKTRMGFPMRRKPMTAFEKTQFVGILVLGIPVAAVLSLVARVRG